MWRRSALLLLAVALASATASAAGARADARTHFRITGGTVTVQLAADLLDVFAADNAVLTAGGGASIHVVAKTKQTILTLPVAGGLAAGGVVELAAHCRCVSFTTRGSLYLTGNGKRMTLTKPYFAFDGKTGKAYVAFTQGTTMQSTVDLPPTTLPRSLAGNTFARSGLAGTVNPGSRWVFKGYEKYPGEPGDGAAPNYPIDRAVAFGTIAFTLRLKPLT